MPSDFKWDSAGFYIWISAAVFDRSRISKVWRCAHEWQETINQSINTSFTGRIMDVFGSFFEPEPREIASIKVAQRWRNWDGTPSHFQERRHTSTMKKALISVILVIPVSGAFNSTHTYIQTGFTLIQERSTPLSVLLEEEQVTSRYCLGVLI